MAKKIKITEHQLKMLNKKLIEESNKPKGRVMKITESQYKRLFENKIESEEMLHEDLGLWETSLDFINYMVGWLNDLSNDNTQVGLDPIWRQFGKTRKDFFNLLMDIGIISVVAAKGGDTYRVVKRNIILNLKRLYNEFASAQRYDNKTGEIISNDTEKDAVQQEGMGGDDMEYELEETTTTGGVGGSFEAPMSGSGPQRKFKNYPDDELNEENIDETTSTGDASGAYVQPKIWAKDPNNSRFSNDPMYPDGKIIKKNKQ